jgi:uncharacterized membrane protein YheB (UPF0754 family)
MTAKPDALLVNPEDWSPKQLEQWLRRFEKGRFKSLAPKLRKYSGYELVHLPSGQWAQLAPRDLVASLRVTLLGMTQVAVGQDGSPSEALTIVTDFTPRGLPSPRKPAKGVALTDPTTKGVEPRKPAAFPPMLEVPSLPVILLTMAFIIAAALCFTVLKKPLEDVGVDSHHLVKYGSIPIVSVGFTYIHIWLALYMTFYPLAYMGCLQIPGTNTGLGWQGIVPNKAEKMARQAVRTMTTRLIRVSDVFAKLEPARIVDELEPVLFGTIRDIVDQMAMKYNPDLWAVLSEDIKEEIVEKVKEEAPGHIESLMLDLRTNIEDVFDIEDMVVSHFCKDTQLLVNMFISCGYQELVFIRNSGAWMGFLFGLLQMGLWFFYSNRIVVFPVIGLVVGLVTNWLALKMIFEPIEPKRVACFTLHGLFLRRQHQVAEVYGRLVASEILTSRNIIDAILKGPFSDRLFELVYDNVQHAVNEATAATEQIASLGLGEATYASMKQDVTDHIVNAFPASLREIETYANEAMELETTLRDKMKTLTSAEFEELLHPIFEEDEWKLVLMGGVLGLVIGFLQAFFINH